LQIEIYFSIFFVKNGPPGAYNPTSSRPSFAASSIKFEKTLISRLFIFLLILGLLQKTQK
jgi:hypothetical protein